MSATSALKDRAEASGQLAHTAAELRAAERSADHLTGELARTAKLLAEAQDILAHLLAEHQFETERGASGLFALRGIWPQHAEAMRDLLARIERAGKAAI